MQPAAPAAAVYTNTVRIGYARVSGRMQDHQMQLDALAAADCREVIVETASTRGGRPKLRVTLDTLRPGDTLVIYKPDRIARSMKELLAPCSATPTTGVPAAGRVPSAAGCTTPATSCPGRHPAGRAFSSASSPR
ncbi:recombinase family protein [Actinomadura rudentiformis]|uniref:Recombinase family protein n=1 Tax=Actinomadura rudentiformis TaxID=359158 RepID=A0A6H9YT63_9ACTN|nr:recombinase family protein [Actinomadura rudentiformis]KAB2350071.1 recombinase family protein [Actinomadura rudentiformis]